MWIQVRGMVGGDVEKVSNLSRLTPVSQLRKRLKHWGPAKMLRLFCRGKEMLDGYSLFDYNVGLNEMVLVLVKKGEEGKKEVDGKKKDKKSIGGDDDHDDKGCDEDDDEKENQSGNSVPKDAAGDDDDTTKIGEEDDDGTPSTRITDAVTDSSTTTYTTLKSSSIPTTTPESSSELSTFKASSSSAPPSFKPGDIIDARQPEMGAWFEADVMKMTDQSGESLKGDHDGYVYHLKFQGEDDITTTTSNHIRPRAQQKLSFDEIEVNDKVMLNYNYDEPKKRGYWYDAVISEKELRKKKIKATVYIGKDLIGMEDCTIVFTDEIFAIASSLPTTAPPLRASKAECDECLDDPDVLCKECSCSVCGGKHDPHLQLLCDECSSAFHLSCLTPPLSAVPLEDDWFCADCKLDSSEVVAAGERLKQSAKRSKMASANSSSKRDWGKVCTIVSQNHFGAVPGVEVGALWKYRVQVSEAGVHRPHVAGIHGRENEGAYSIVLSGGYEDDKDDGEEFTYTGSGGRDLSGNKRTAGQSCDQVLSRMNKALAKNCDAPINDKVGAEAADWTKGKPVRVVRNCKAKKHSKYAPEEGNRYDGIYKVVKYWPGEGMSGFLVWKYLLRRDDPQPAPWTEEGKRRSSTMGLHMQYPDGYEEKEGKKGEKKKKDGEEEEEEEEEIGDDDNVGKNDRKRKSVDKDDGDDDDDGAKKRRSKAKKAKTDKDGVSGVQAYRVEEAVMALVQEDEVNQKMWSEVLEAAKRGKITMLKLLQSSVTCIYCQDLPHLPITTLCHHHFCKKCLERSFKAGVSTCGMCRQELKGDDGLKVNEALSGALQKLFPGYGVGR